MRPNRSLAAALVLPLAIAGLLAAGTSHSAAAQRHDVAAPTQQVSAGPRIQGVVADQNGHYMDNVEVHAVNSSGATAASDFTYASDRAYGEPHGFFNLSVRRLGTYTVSFSKDGYVTQSRTVEVTRRPRIVLLGEIDLKVKPRGTTTDAGLKSAKVTTADKARVVVQVATGATKKPVGDVTVLIGRKKVGSDTLTASDRGSVTIGLQRLAVGTYKVRAIYAGSRKQNLAASTSGPVTLQVVRAKHRHH